MFSPTIQKLIDLFAKFPTVGPRTAARFVFYLLKLPGEEAEKIISAISNLKEKVKTCHSCFNSFEGEGKLCVICKDSNRDKSLLCVVEKESDLASIEKIKKYNGLYFSLGETVSTLKKSGLLKLRTKELEERIKEQKNIQEIIIAINPTAEGETIALYLEKLLKKLLPEGKRVTRLGRGLPLGGEIEYADEETISSAFEGRR